MAAEINLRVDWQLIEFSRTLCYTRLLISYSTDALYNDVPYGGSNPQYGIAKLNVKGRGIYTG
jgi:hypothetical protein